MSHEFHFVGNRGIVNKAPLVLHSRATFNLMRGEGGIGEQRGGGRGDIPPFMSKKVLPPRPTTKFLLSPPLEAAKKLNIFVQNCQHFAAFLRLSRKFSCFVFYSSPLPPSKRRNLPPPRGSKNHSPPPQFG